MYESHRPHQHKTPTLTDMPLKLPPTITQLLRTPPTPSSTVTIAGYVRSVRHLKRLSFLDLSDNSSHRQLMCVLSPDQAKHLRTGQSVRLTGEWLSSRGQEQAYELNTASQGSVEVLGDVPDDYPLQKKFHSLTYLRSLTSLRWKTSYMAAILRLRGVIDTRLHSFFDQEEFVKVQAPVITSSDCEGAGELFTVESKSLMAEGEKFFAKDVYLTVSTQLHLEVLAASLGRVWSLSPTFRAESSDTNRHLAEFWMLEAEVSFIDSVHQLAHLTEAMVKHVVAGLINTSAGEDFLKSLPSENAISPEKLQARWETLYNTEWKSLSYGEAIEILKKSGKPFKIPVKYEDGLATEHEKYLAGEHFQNTPLFITDYPELVKPFYMLPNRDNSTVACFDLILPQIGELIGGSLRDHSPTLRQKMERLGMNTSEMEWYLSTRDNGTVPHGGFGMGMERLVCYLGGVDNVRDVVSFSRARGECAA